MSHFYKELVGQAVTITTVQPNFRFKEEQMMDYFMGLVHSIDDNTIVIIHPQTKQKNYIFLKYVIGIHVEPILYEDNPEDKKIIDEYRQKKPELAEKTKVPPTKFLNPTALAEMAKQAKAIGDKK